MAGNQKLDLLFPMDSSNDQRDAGFMITRALVSGVENSGGFRSIPPAPRASREGGGMIADQSA